MGFGDVVPSKKWQVKDKTKKNQKKKAQTSVIVETFPRRYRNDLSHKTGTRFPYYPTRQHVSLFPPVPRVKALLMPFTSQQPTLPCLTVGQAGH
ncbi:hypothetical protein O3P69_015567 [Scylla paramamosain]|uniref:Uncharacterized protein n=1 Tax=Scylla paramamosain TaxID=85552 RepID=A0AAW0SAJ1_SCYPA